MKKMLLFFIMLLVLIIGCNTSTGPAEDDVTAPAAPTNLAIDTDNSFDDAYILTWTANQESDLDGYRVYKANENTDNAFRLAGEVGMNDEEFSGSGLNYDSTYYFKISAFDKSGNESELSEVVSHQPLNINVPTAPSNLKAYGYNYGDAPYLDIQWSQNTDSDFDHYEVYKHTSAQFPTSETYLLVQTTDPNYEDYAVVVGTKYYYRIIAVDKGGLKSTSSANSYISDLALVSPTLTAPSNNSTTTSRTPSFSWEYITNATKYKIYVQSSQQSDVVWEEEITQPTDQSSDVSITIPSNKLNVNQTYWWKVAVFSSDNTAANAYSSTWKFNTPQ